MQYVRLTFFWSCLTSLEKHCVKDVGICSFPGSYFPALELNLKICACKRKSPYSVQTWKNTLLKTSENECFLRSNDYPRTEGAYLKLMRGGTRTATKRLHRGHLESILVDRISSICGWACRLCIFYILICLASQSCNLKAALNTILPKLCRTEKYTLSV